MSALIANTMELRELPISTVLSHGGEKKRRAHELYVNGEMIRRFDEDSQRDNYQIGVHYDSFVSEEVSKLEKALVCKCQRTSTRHWTAQLKASIFDLVYGDPESFEWSGEAEGQGNGPHSSGPGPIFAACPVCGGLKEPNGHFVDEAVGHRADCKLRKLLDDAEALAQRGRS